MKSPESRLLHVTFHVIFAFVVAASSGSAQAMAESSPWVQGSKTKARLLAGRVPSGAQGQTFAFVEIALEPGWKTYWRTPGDAGGLPPSFDWSKSSNLAAAQVAFPAPRRFTDKSGNTIGYEGGVVLPVTLTPESAEAPISLVVGLQYGICKDVCIPVEVELALDVPADGGDEAPAAALEALDSIPRAQDKRTAGDPELVRAGAVLDGAAPKITIAARFPGGAGGADAFLEAPDGLFLPLPARIGDADGDAVVFEAPLDRDVDLAALRGKPVTVTLVGETGASFATFVAE